MTIGQKLSEQRRKLGKSLKEVEADLRIRQKYLESLEQDRFDLLPGEAYVKAFLRTYSSYLGLDPDQIIEEYNALYARETEEQTSIINSFPSRSLLRFLAIVFLATIIALAVWLSIPERKPLPRMPAPPVEENITTPTPKKQESEKKIPQLEPTTEPTKSQPSMTPMQLTLKVTGDSSCWVRVKNDSQTIFERTLKPGESETLDLTTTVSVRLGNPSSISIYLNGKELTGYPKKGVVDLTIDSTGVKVR